MQNDPLRDFLKFFRFHLAWFILSAGFFAVILISGIFLSTKYVVDTATEQVADTVPSATPEELVLVATPEPSLSPTVLTPSPTPTESPLAEPAPIPVPQSDQSNSQNGSTHTVTAGDTLWNISERTYGSGHLYTRISQVNNLSNADVIQVGQILTLPVLSDQEKALVNQKGSITTEAWSDDKTVYKNYTIVSGDSLWKIAERELGDAHRWMEIYQANESVIGSNPDLIYPDVVLRIPADSLPVSSVQHTSTWTSTLLQ